MAEGDGQVVFSVVLDDTGFQESLAALEASLLTLQGGAVSALSLGAAQLSEAFIAGGQWVDSVAAGMAANRAASSAAVAAVNAAASSARSAGRSGGMGVGQNIVAGMASGVTSMGGSLNAALTRIVQQGLQAAKRAAGISSPSRLFRDEVGQYLALGVQSGFVDTMQAAVLPAIGRSVGQSARASRAALESTLLSGVGQALGEPLSMAAAARAGASSLGTSAALAAGGVPAAAPGEAGTVNVTQQIVFQTTPQAPDEVARAIRRQATYGLAGARA